jgi:ABC-type transport system involved in multi-copper enzyme maturation permease subunit
MNFSLATLLIGTGLILVQLLAALPWVLVGFAKREVLARGAWNFLSDLVSNRKGVVLLAYVAGGGFVASAMLSLLLFSLTRDKDAVENWGQLYGSVLQFQLILDFFVVVFPLLLWVWPKGGAVAQAAFREGVRQPMFWLLLGFAMLALGISPFWPYFTFGEDYVMVKDLGYDIIMLATVAFGVLAATLFVTEEIEGRTAVTLMSKPVSRRQFLLGKFVGILLVGLLMFGLLGLFFQSTLLLKRYLDPREYTPATAAWVTSLTAHTNLPPDVTDFVRGGALWTSLSLETLPGLVASFCQVMVLVSIAVALATRLPMVLNLVLVVSVFLVSHLTPNLVSKARRLQELNPGSVVAQMLSFVAQVFDTLLPGLDFFRIDQVLVTDAPPDPGPYALYILSVLFYALLYTVVVILFGLVLFEDRDLA